jgi:hypothetical protein
MANTTGKKYGGRELGTPNKLTKELKQAINNVIYQEMELITDHLNKIEPKERLDLLVKLLPYVIPKATQELSDNENIEFFKTIILNENE